MKFFSENGGFIRVQWLAVLPPETADVRFPSETMFKEVQYLWERANHSAGRKIATSVGDSAARLRDNRGQHSAEFVGGLGGNEKGRGLHPEAAASCGLRRLDGIYNIGLCPPIPQ